MGDRLGEQDGYPAGVSNADFGEDPPCCCGHLADDHGPTGCSVCSACLAYEPEEDDRA